jgi:hypothetical protein
MTKGYKMKKNPWLVPTTVAIGMVGLMLLPAETTKKPDANTEMRALRQQIEQLQSRFKTIGDRLTKLEAVRSRAVCGVLRLCPIRPEPRRQ